MVESGASWRKSSRKTPLALQKSHTKAKKICPPGQRFDSLHVAIDAANDKDDVVFAIAH